jgi:CheY-like chemotaxis protein
MSGMVGDAKMNALSGKRVLVVEDDMLVGMMIEEMLADLGAVCVAVSPTVADALAELEKTPIDAAILDLNLRGERSIPVADWLSARAIPFAFATGYGDAGEGTAGRPILAKPYTPEQLSDALCKLLKS